MAIEKEVFYSVRCDRCYRRLEDYTGEIARLTYARKIAKQIAKQSGFVQISQRAWIWGFIQIGISKKWLCPECAKKLQTFEKI